jgi:phosphinothricin acetyltransferase
MAPADWPAVAAIYAEGLEAGTFETEVPSWETWDETHLAAPRLVARLGGAVCGWAALSPVSRRHVYRGVAEDSVYVAGRARGRGVGRALLGELVRSSDEAGIWTIQASCFPENAASIRLHESCGFRVVGTRERIAQREGVWRDVVLLERRSPAVA